MIFPEQIMSRYGGVLLNKASCFSLSLWESTYIILWVNDHFKLSAKGDLNSLIYPGLLRREMEHFFKRKRLIGGLWASPLLQWLINCVDSWVAHRICHSLLQVNSTHSFWSQTFWSEWETHVSYLMGRIKLSISENSLVGRADIFKQLAWRR